MCWLGLAIWHRVIHAVCFGSLVAICMLFMRLYTFELANFLLLSLCGDMKELFVCMIFSLEGRGRTKGVCNVVF